MTPNISGQLTCQSKAKWTVIGHLSHLLPSCAHCVFLSLSRSMVGTPEHDWTTAARKDMWLDPRQSRTLSCFWLVERGERKRKSLRGKKNNKKIQLWIALTHQTPKSTQNHIRKSTFFMSLYFFISLSFPPWTKITTITSFLCSRLTN